jgi:hypothetical protein
MRQFQVRTPLNMVIEDVFIEVTLRVWETIQEYLKPSENTAHHYKEFRDRFCSMMIPYIRAFGLCGTSRICSSEVVGARWLDDQDRIYHLVIPNNCDAFIDELAWELLIPLRPHLNDTSLSVFRLLRVTLWRELGAYTYYNPVCGKAELCSASLPVNPWLPKVEIPV